jgi:hypothetical protein
MASASREQNTAALAIAISYTANHSIFWAIIHGIFGWLYVIYFALFRS